MPMPWFRFYAETINDRKLRLIADELEISFAEIIGIWAILLCLVNDSPVESGLYVTLQKRYTIEQIARYATLPNVTVEKIINSMVEYEILRSDNGALFAINWWKRQFRSDNSSERVKKFRNEHKPKRFRNVSETPPDTDTDTDTDTEAEAEEGTNVVTLSSRNVTQIQNQNQIQNQSRAEGEATTAPFRPVYSNPSIMHIFSSVTGMAMIPASEIDKVIPAIEGLQLQHPDENELIEYLEPFYKTWCQTRTKDGRFYSKLNCAWLYDYAVSGQMPGPQTNGKKQRTPEEQRVYENSRKLFLESLAEEEAKKNATSISS